MNGMSPKNAFGDGIGLVQEVGLKLAKFGVTPAMLGRVPRENELAKNLATVLKETAVTIRLVNPYADEVVISNYRYPDGYQPRSTVDQLLLIQQRLPELDSSYVVAELADQRKDLHQGADIFQVWPKLSAIAKVKGIKNPYTSGYGKCLEVALTELGKSRRFSNYEEGATKHARHARLLQSTKEMYKQLEKETPGDYLIEPIQSGLLYAGHSVRNARWEIEHANQWSLDPYAVSWHILTYPERLSARNDLWIDCPGAEYPPSDYDSYQGSFYFDSGGGIIGFGLHGIDIMLDKLGSSSAFLRE